MKKVENESQLPAIPAVSDGAEVDVAALARGSWAVVLLYRGHW